MNTNPVTGERLSEDELAELALKAGIIDDLKLESMTAALHNGNRIRSWLEQITMELRHAMWARGELTFDVRPGSNYVAPEPPPFDWELYEWLKGRRA